MNRLIQILSALLVLIPCAYAQPGFYDTNADTICSGSTTYLDGEGNCDTLIGGHTNGANCSAGEYPLGVDEDGVVESCTDATTEIDAAISTHASDADAHQDLVTLTGAGTYLSLSGQEITVDEITESDISDLSHTTDTGPSPDCSGTTTYQDGEGNCDDLSSVYEPVKTSSDTEVLFDNSGTIDGVTGFTSNGTNAILNDERLYLSSSQDSYLVESADIIELGWDAATVAQRLRVKNARLYANPTMNSGSRGIELQGTCTNGGCTGLFSTIAYSDTSGSAKNALTAASANVSWTSDDDSIGVITAFGGGLGLGGSGDHTEVNMFTVVPALIGSGTITKFGVFDARGAVVTGAHTITQGYNYEVQAPTLMNASAVVTDWDSIKIFAPATSTPMGTFTNLRGLTIEDFGSTATTVNWEMLLEAGAEIFFRDGDLRIGSSADGQLDFYSDTTFKFNTGQVEFENYSFPVADGSSSECLQTDGAGTLSFGSCGGGSQNLFETINTTSGTSPVADSATDTLNISAGTGITVTGDSATDTVTIATTVTDTNTQNTLDEAYDEGGAGSGRSIDADSGPVEITVSDTDNNTALSLVQNDSTNNPNTLVMTNAGTGKPIAIENTETTATAIDYEFYSNDTGGLLEDMQTMTFYEDNASGTKTAMAQIAHVASSVMTAGDEIGVMEMRVSDQGAMTKMFQFFGGSASFPNLKQSVFFSHLHFDPTSGAEYAISGGQYAFAYNSGGTAFPNHTLAGIQFVATGTTGINFINTLGNTVERHDVVNNRSQYASGYTFDSLNAGGALNYGTTNGGALTYGNATNTTAQTFNTDGTGNGEIVLPNDSIGAAEIDSTTGAYDFGGVTSFELRNGTALPGTCAVGQYFHDTNSNDCANTGGGDGAVCVCKSTNTWALVADI